MADVVRIRLWAEMSSIANSTQEDVTEIPREEWDAMTQKERDERLNAEAEVFISNEVAGGAYVLAEEG